MKVIVLSKDTVINNKIHLKSEVVKVPDNFDVNIREVVKKSDTIVKEINLTKAQLEQVKLMNDEDRQLLIKQQKYVNQSK